jgi:hypothetical protein
LDPIDACPNALIAPVTPKPLLGHIPCSCFFEKEAAIVSSLKPAMFTWENPIHVVTLNDSSLNMPSHSFLHIVF